jgi:exo-1,4-beta-D-glucosaminidase
MSAHPSTSEGRAARGARARFMALIVVMALMPRVATAQHMELRTGWWIQSSERVGTDGGRISAAAYATSAWIPATAPATVVGAQVQAGIFKDPFFGMNMRALPGMSYPVGAVFAYREMDPNSPYAKPWWYRRSFTIPRAWEGRRVILHFDGINYRANIWLNGKRIADSAAVAGAFRRYELDITAGIARGRQNVLAVEIFAPTSMDLAPTWLDWNPAPPDRMMGLWQPVSLSAEGDVAIRYPQVISHVDTATLSSADLTVGTLLRNWSDHAVTGVLAGKIGSRDFHQRVTIDAHDSAYVRFTPDSFPLLHVAQPRLWWPRELGTPALQTLSLRFTTRGGVSDSQSIRFGIREITAELTAGGAELFRVNGRRILIRGGGWTPDLFMRPQPARQAAELRYALDLHLNALRLEGDLANDTFWQRADSLGLLIMDGWPCCTIFEKWAKWTPEQYAIAALSERDQIRRLRAHASALVWLNGSDKPPPPDVERTYIAMLEQEHWPNPYISSASATATTVTGPSGVKMTGPYDWVPPSYWLLDTKHGGAWGFNTETSPGPAVPPMESMRRMMPERDLWPIDSVWVLHAAGGSKLNHVQRFTNALTARYGAPQDAQEYTRESQLMTYEGERAMFEAYRRNAYVSTGVIQWMFNNAWPSVYWHLFDWYLRPGGGYFGAKKGNEPLHVMYSYDDGSIAVVNALRHAVRRVRVRVRVFNLDMQPRFTRDTLVDVPADSSLRVLTLPTLTGLSRTYFVDLRLIGASDSIVSSNLYWLSTHPDELAFDSTNAFVTAASQLADFTALRALPATHVRTAVSFTQHGNSGEARVTLTNTGASLAFFMRLRIDAGADGDEVLPVEWSDNYMSLLPGESRQLTARYDVRALHGRRPTLRVSGANVVN